MKWYLFRSVIVTKETNKFKINKQITILSSSYLKLKSDIGTTSSLVGSDIRVVFLDTTSSNVALAISTANVKPTNANTCLRATSVATNIEAAVVEFNPIRFFESNVAVRSSVPNRQTNDKHQITCHIAPGNRSHLIFGCLVDSKTVISCSTAKPPKIVHGKIGRARANSLSFVIVVKKSISDSDPESTKSNTTTITSITAIKVSVIFDITAVIVNHNGVV